MKETERNRLSHHLLYAVQTSTLSQVSELIQAGADVNQKVCGNFPLDLVSELGNLEIARFLIQHGADINLAKSNGITAIYTAAVFGRFDVVKLLILNGAQIDTATNFNSRRIERPVEYGFLEVVELLLQYGANTCDNLFYTHNNLDMAKLLLKYGADVNVTNERGETPLHECILVNHFEIANLIVNHIAKLEVAGLYVSQELLQQKSEFINNSQARRNNYSQHFQKYTKEIKRLAKENKPLCDFLKKSNINKLANIWEQNENLRNKFDDSKSLKEQYPEYAHMLINKANEVKKEIFLHNHLPLFGIFAKRYKCDFDDINFTGIKTFLKAHNNDFKAELEGTGTTLMNFVEFEDVRERHPALLHRTKKN